MPITHKIKPNILLNEKPVIVLHVIDAKNYEVVLANSAAKKVAKGGRKKRLVKSKKIGTVL